MEPAGKKYFRSLIIHIMQNFLRTITRFFISSILACFLSLPVFAQETQEGIFIEKYLHAGNFEVQKPAFYNIENLDGKSFSDADLLKADYVKLDGFEPAEGNQLSWKSNNYEWEAEKTARDNYIFLEKKPVKNEHQIAFIAAYIQANRWVEAELKIHSPQMFEVYLDNNKIKSKETEQQDDEDPGSVSVNFKLKRGKHLLLIKTLKTAENNSDWKFKTQIKPDSTFSTSDLRVGISTESFMSIEKLLDGKHLQSADISPDGKMAMLKYYEVIPPKGKRESWTEIREIESNRLVHIFMESDLYGMKWLPESPALSYETSNDDQGSSLWVFNLEDRTVKKVLENKKDFGSYTWSENEQFIIYTINEEPKDDDVNLKRFEGMPDRWPWWRNRSFLYKLDISSGVSEQLTYGHVSTGLMDIRPDGQKVLFSQSIPDFSERPYSRQFLMEMDLNTYNIDTIWEKNFSGNCSYAPDGMHLLVTGSPAMFGLVGTNLSDDMIPNDYDTQAYIYNMISGEVDPITFNFNPSIENAIWNKYDPNQIIFHVSDRTYKKVFRYDLNTRYFEEIPTGFDVVSSLSMAKSSPLAICRGSNISTPPFANVVDFSTLETTMLADPRADINENVVFGKTEEWNFTNANGVEIEGRIYYPPDFDEKKDYPLIVYYYAGTSPTERSFGGRYPKNLFAAHGYIVYNLQPSGATGYGQDFSAAHVNNWGISVADEIIEGTKLFLEDHDFIDPEKVGCIGASYGGFMTMLLQTRTDIFSAAISHAGISSISSYWGEGYWGYLYSSVASANSFPWNNKKLYVEQSALFNADKINTPLLLLHGGDDTNVPPGESIQLYTALKLLGRPVELIEIEGQNHHIVNYEKRIEWQNTIFAWFDKWLKGQPQWWDNLYPDRNL
jgi:dipeptidyl aminopeptidase/acylaminoacyl peptidase